jgi:hypothetical protein
LGCEGGEGCGVFLPAKRGWTDVSGKEDGKTIEKKIGWGRKYLSMKDTDGQRASGG